VRCGGDEVTILNATNARKNFFQVMEEAITTHDPIYVTGKSGNVVLISEEDFRAMQETIYLTSIPGMREKIKEGLKTQIDELVEDADE
jgi:prevent-host-death family protein